MQLKIDAFDIILRAVRVEITFMHDMYGYRARNSRLIGVIEIACIIPTESIPCSTIRTKSRTEHTVFHQT